MRGARAAAARRRAREARRRRWVIAAAIAGVLAPAVALGAVALANAGPHPQPEPRALTPAESVCAAVAVYSDEQWTNAATVVEAGRAAGLTERDQTIGVMTALGESSLRNIDYGDWETRGVTNPDGTRTTSIGLFQQQDGWGTREERLDPYTAAAFFYRAMVSRVPEPERSALEPTLVAHRTQVNRDPQHYARYWPGAQDLVAALAQGGCR